MIIVFEGLDGTGKTTTAEMFSDRTGWPLTKMSCASTHRYAIEEMSKVYNYVLFDLRRFNFVSDRAFLSTIVYHKVYRREFDISYIYDTLELIKNDVIFVVFLYEQYRTSDNIIRPEYYDEIASSYKSVVKDLIAKQYNVITVEKQFETVEDRIDYIIAELRKKGVDVG